MQIFPNTHLCSPWPSFFFFFPLAFWQPRGALRWCVCSPSPWLSSEPSSGARGFLGWFNDGCLEKCQKEVQLSRTPPCQGDILLVLDAGPCSMEQTQGRAQLQPPQCPHPAHSPGSLWGPPPALALWEPSPSPRKKARPPHKSWLFGCHLLPVISASRRAVPTLSWPFPTYVPITGWAGGEGRLPGAAPSAPP